MRILRISSFSCEAAGNPEKPIPSRTVRQGGCRDSWDDGSGGGGWNAAWPLHRRPAPPDAPDSEDGACVPAAAASLPGGDAPAAAPGTAARRRPPSLRWTGAVCGGNAAGTVTRPPPPRRKPVRRPGGLRRAQTHTRPACGRPAAWYPRPAQRAQAGARRGAGRKSAPVPWGWVGRFSSPCRCAEWQFQRCGTRGWSPDDPPCGPLQSAAAD